MGTGGGTGSGEGGIRGIQLEGSCKHFVGVYDYGDDGASDNNGAGSRGERVGFNSQNIANTDGSNFGYYFRFK